MAITQVGPATVSDELLQHITDIIKNGQIAFVDLSDTPDYAGQNLKFLQAVSGGGQSSMEWADLPASGLNWTVQDEDVTAEDKQGYLCVGGITITLPDDPEEGNLVVIADKDQSFNETPVTVDSPSHPIEGQDDRTLLIDLKNAYVQLVFDGENWIISQVNHPFNIQNISEETFPAGGIEYTLSRVPPNSEALLVNMGGSILPTTQYSVIGNILRLNTSATAQLYVRHIGVPSGTKVADSPVGMVAWFPNTSPSDGWLDLTGGTITKEMYPDLVRYLTKDPSATMATLMDARGMFPRIWDHGSGIDVTPSTPIPNILSDNSWGEWLGTLQETTARNAWDANANTLTSVKFESKEIGYAFDSAQSPTQITIYCSEFVSDVHLPTSLQVFASADGITWSPVSSVIPGGSALNNAATNIPINAGAEGRYWSIRGTGGIVRPGSEYYWGVGYVTFTGVSTDRVVGSKQLQSVGPMNPTLSGQPAGTGQVQAGAGANVLVAGGAGDVTGGQETRPDNIALVLRIKAFHQQSGSLSSTEVTALRSEVARLASDVSNVTPATEDEVKSGAPVNGYINPENIQYNAYTQSVTHLTYSTAVADDNSKRNFLKVGDRGGAEFRRAANQAEYDSFPDSAKFTDASAILWVLSIYDNVDLSWLDPQVSNDIRLVDALGIADIPVKVYSKTDFICSVNSAEIILRELNRVYFYDECNIELPGEEISLTSRINLSNPTFMNLVIYGEENTSLQVSSVQNTSNIASNHTVDYVVNNSTGAAVGSYLLVTAANAGREFVEGCYRIEAVNGNTITVKHTLGDSWPDSSGSLATAYILNTVLRWGPNSSGLVISGADLRGISNLVIAGNYNVSIDPPEDSSIDGLQVGSASDTHNTGLNESERISSGSCWGSRIGIVEWNGNGVQVFGGHLYLVLASSCSNGWRGFQAGSSGSLSAKGSSAIGNGSSGYECEENAVVNASNSVSCGNLQQGYYAIHGTLLINSIVSIYNAFSGIDARRGANVVGDIITSRFNGVTGLQSIDARVTFQGTTVFSDNTVNNLSISNASVIVINDLENITNVSIDETCIATNTSGELYVPIIKRLSKNGIYENDVVTTSIGDFIFRTKENDTYTSTWRIRNSGHLIPDADNVFPVGSATNRPTELFAVNGSINTSDETLKMIEEIPDEWVVAANAIKKLIIRFKWISEVEKEDKVARWHIGYPAQGVYQACKDSGIEDPWELSFLCKDVLETELEDGSVIPMVNPDGSPVERWGLRVSELNTLLHLAD